MNLQEAFETVQNSDEHNEAFTVIVEAIEPFLMKLIPAEENRQNVWLCLHQAIPASDSLPIALHSALSDWAENYHDESIVSFSSLSAKAFSDLDETTFADLVEDGQAHHHTNFRSAYEDHPAPRRQYRMRIKIPSLAEIVDAQQEWEADLGAIQGEREVQRKLRLLRQQQANDLQKCREDRLARRQLRSSQKKQRLVSLEFWRSEQRRITWNSSRQQWEVSIRHESKEYYVGRFAEKEEAIRARKEVESNVGEWVRNRNEQKKKWDAESRCVSPVVGNMREVRYRADFSVDGEQYYLGTFATQSEALEARKAAEADPVGTLKSLAEKRAEKKKVAGVKWSSRSKKWVALFRHKQQVHYLGYFEDRDEAIAAVQQERDRIKQAA